MTEGEGEPTPSTLILPPSYRPAPSNSRRGVLGGAVLLAIGVAFLLPPLGVPNAGAYLFIALGLAFAAAWWFGARQYVYLVPAGVLIGFGVGLVVPRLLELPSDTGGPVFLGALALGLAAVYALAPHRRLTIAPAVVVGVVALASLLFRMQLIPGGLEPYFVPAILIIVGFYLLVEPRGH